MYEHSPLLGLRTIPQFPSGAGQNTRRSRAIEDLGAGGAAAKFQHKLHHQVFQLVAHLAEHSIVLAHGIEHYPVARGNLQSLGNWLSAHIDHDIERSPLIKFKALGKLLVDRKIFFQHGLASHIGNALGGHQPGAEGVQYVGTVSAGEPFRHLAAAGVADANK